MVQPGSPLLIFPHSEGLRQRIWWGAGSNYSAEQSARDGVNMMSSTLVFESDDRSFDLSATKRKRPRDVRS